MENRGKYQKRHLFPKNKNKLIEIQNFSFKLGKNHSFSTMYSKFNIIKKKDIDNWTTTHNVVWVRKLKSLVKKEQKLEAQDALANLVEKIVLLLGETLYFITSQRKQTS